jgi:hypothetical protein
LFGQATGIDLYGGDSLNWNRITRAFIVEEAKIVKLVMQEKMKNTKAAKKTTKKSGKK